MPAVADREPSKHDFIGQVFTKASPILTWRPVKVQRITPATSDAEATPGDPSVPRASRATTRRMVAWPVVRGIERARGPALRALLTLVTFSLLCGSALTLCVYLFVGESTVAWHSTAPATRVGVAHVADESFDLLLPASTSPVAAFVTAPATAPLATVEPHRAAVRPLRGRAQHGHLRASSAAPALHAGRSTHGAGGASRGTT